MKLIIAHRGLVDGPDSTLENDPATIDYALQLDYDVEIDLRYKDNNFYLGHDFAQYKIEEEWLQIRKKYLWIHCKDVETLLQLKSSDFNYFWHENDTLTLTSHGYIWAYPGKQPIKGSIAVLPEIHDDDISACFGVCTDYPERYEY